MIVVLKMVIADTMLAASEFIKIGDIEAAKKFISMRLHIELIKYRLEKTSVMKVDIQTAIHTGDWVDVQLNTKELE